PYNFNDWFMKQMITKLLFNVDEYQLKELHEIFERGYSVFDSLALDSMLPVNLSAEFEVKAILGIYKPSIDVPNPRSFYDVLQSIIDTAGALNEKRMLVLLHITKYCTKEQLDYLARDILRQELQVLSLEWTDHLFRFEDGRSWYVDEDFVQFP
ncbi:type II-A CRISPR-associated protein Csn2, partial [Alloscardovia theropitheci]